MCLLVFAVIASFVASSKAMIFSGTAARLDTAQIISKSGWMYIANWDYMSASNKPGIFLKGLSVDETKKTFTINKPGAYYVSYNLILKSITKATFTGGVVIDNDPASGLVLKNIQRSNGATVHVTAAGVLRLTSFNNFSVIMNFNKSSTENGTVTIQPGSTLTMALVTTAGVVPAFSFKLKHNVAIPENYVKSLSDWFTGMKGAFHISVGFLPSRNYVQAICDGIYMLSINLILKGAPNGTSVIKVTVNQFVLQEVQIKFDNSTTRNWNIQQIMSLYKADIVKMSVTALKYDSEVLLDSTFSMALVNKKSPHTSGFNAYLRSNFTINSIDNVVPISGWPNDFNGLTEFKSPEVFSQLVNDRQDFSAPQRGVYVITANLKLQWESVINAELTASIYSNPSKFHLAKKTIRYDGSGGIIFISLSTTAAIQNIDPLSVSIQIQYGTVYVLPGSSFSVVQLPIFYPGMLGRLIRANSFSKTGWHAISSWKTEEVKGGYDFLSSTNSTSGKYKVPIEGLYMVSANIIIEDLEEVQAFITNNEDLRFEDGIFTKVGNPTSTMTLNVGGIMQLKKNDLVYVMVNSPSDTDWSVKANTGFSIAYIGQQSHVFRAYVPSVIEVTKAEWTNISNWRVSLQHGSSFTSSSGTFLIPVSGVYHTTAIAILRNADSEITGSEYNLAILINGVPVTGLRAHMSGPDSVPRLRRFYPLFMSGSFKAHKGDVVTLGVHSSKDTSFDILEFSTWSLFLVAEDNNLAQIGFSTSKSVLQYFPKTDSDEWYEMDNWRSGTSNVGSFYTPSYINFDDGIGATIRMTGFYLISANIKVQGDPSPSVFQLALFIQDELQQNGISYENIRKWNSFTLHLVGVAFLVEGETVKLKIASTGKFDGLVIFKESGFSMVRLQIAERFPGASLISTKAHSIPLNTNLPIDFWSVENNAASFTFTSGDRYNKTSGVFKVRIAGYYLASMNLILGTEDAQGRNISVKMQYGSNEEIYLVELNNSSVSTVSSTILKYLEVGSTIYIATNTTLINEYHNSTDHSNISLQEGSGFSVVHFPLGADTIMAEAEYTHDVSYSTPGVIELSDWSLKTQIDRSAAIYRAGVDGIHYLSMNLKLINLVGSATFYFNSNRGPMATSIVNCKQRCQEHITLNNFVQLLNGDRISVFVKIATDTHFTIAKRSMRSITFIRPSTQEVGLSVRINESALIEDTAGSWKPLYKYASSNNTHGTFDARGNYSSFEGMIIPETGVYQVIINLIIRFASSKSMGIVEVIVSRDGILSISNGLYTKKVIQSGQTSTVSMISSAIIPKWTKLQVMIKSDINVYIEEGSTLSLVHLDSVINEICPDAGPIMGDSLKPSYVATAIVGERRKWQCVAYGNAIPQYEWHKNDQAIVRNNSTLNIKGHLNDTGTYQCVASVNGILAESNKITVQIYDTDECYYGNHSCDGNAACTNTMGSFKCSCNKGFVGNGFHCNDTNECEIGSHNCTKNSICTNTAGSFTCQCADGYLGNGVDYCRDIDECNLIVFENICGEFATCKNIPGSYSCVCKNGFSGVGSNCTDINECSVGTHNCDSNAYCNNTNGTFTCTCKDGFKGNGVKGNCTDINECIILSQTTKNPLSNGTQKLFCHKDAECINFDGYYGCKCKVGYTGNGTYCQDINECELGAQVLKCAATAECLNTPGSYDCKCRLGYSGDGIQCSDIDECATKTFICDPLANCTNNYGSYSCSCPKGYIGDGKACSAGAEIGKSTDPCDKDKSSLTCICKDSKTRDQNILCNGLFVAIIILSVVAVVVILFVIKYIKSRKNIKIGPAKISRAKYIEMEDESEV